MNKKGVALLLALFTLIIISLLLISFLELTTTDLQIVSNHLTRDEALYIADAGVEYAVSQLRNNKNWQVSNETTPFPSGSSNTYAVTYPVDSGIIRSTGRLITGGQVTLEVKVSVTGNAPYKVKIIYYREL